jgi:putative effector of murein hydrolase
MKDVIVQSAYFGVILSIIGYFIGDVINKKLKSSLANPLLIAAFFIAAVLTVFRIDTAIYQNSAELIHYMLAPVTVCLAVPMYERLSVLRQNLKSILVSVFVGTVSSIATVIVFTLIINLTYPETISLMTKSVTAPIGLGITEQYGGMAALTATIIGLTGICGNVIGVKLLKMCHINHPIAIGLAFGTASHVVGTTKALELGEVQGAMSSLSIIVAGFMTVLLMPLVVMLL